MEGPRSEDISWVATHQEVGQRTPVASTATLGFPGPNASPEKGLHGQNPTSVTALAGSGNSGGLRGQDRVSTPVGVRCQAISFSGCVSLSESVEVVVSLVCVYRQTLISRSVSFGAENRTFSSCDNLHGVAQRSQAPGSPFKSRGKEAAPASAWLAFGLDQAPRRREEWTSSSGARNKLVNACGLGALLPPTRHPSPPTSCPRLLPQWVAACAVEDKTWPELAGALPGAGPAAVLQNGPVTRDWGCLGNNIRGLSCLQQRALLFWL